MRYIRFIILFFVLISFTNSQAQLANSLYYLDNLPQSSKLNPARMPNCKVYFTLVNVNTKLLTDFGPQLVFTQDNVINGTLRSPAYNNDTWTNFLNKLDDPMSLKLETEMGIGFGFKANSGYFHFDISERNLLDINLAKDFLTMNNLGEGATKDFSTLSFNTSAFMQLGAGYAYTINNNLSLGLKLKLLKGLGNVYAKINQADLKTSVEYWSFKGDAEANMSLPVGIVVDNDDRIQDIDASKIEDLDPLEYLKEYSKFSANIGAAADIGVEYKVLPNLHLSASLIDFGKIWWNTDVSNIIARTESPDNNEVRFDGIDEEPVYLNDEQNELDAYFEAFGDSLLGLFKTQVTNNEYAANLAPKLYVGAEYLLSETVSLGLLYNSTFYRKKTISSLNFSANANLYHFLTAGAHYAWNFNYANTAGFTLGFNIWPLQIFLATDYIPLRYQYIDMADGADHDLPIFNKEYTPIPVDFNAFNFQLGVNFKFGCRKKYNIPIYNGEYDKDVPGLRKL